ncbi:hypothetical protein CYMTET_26286 [Cymbomonas tetramitiformis]|uniref:RRM domain-containing protein n=1 Tax=Cymbomonas tetramitiformis TaxID=36881 RepID=A0AAE0FSM6_9CHLO|nr:hypothetical protein CYMTET_26286 [Cymbomonas tetramitiformis]|eukprot:gene23087-27937_t
MGKVTRKAVVRLLKAAPDNTMLVKHLRKALSAESGSDSGVDGDVLKQQLKQVLAQLLDKGRIRKDGSDVVLVQKAKRRSAGVDESDGDAEVGENSDQMKEEYEPAAKPADKEPRTEVAEAVQPSQNPSGCTRVFIGNLNFSIEEEELREAIPGITHIKWITDKAKRTFCGTVFVELATPEEAAAAVALSGYRSTLTKAGVLKANFAPARPGDKWPPYGPSSKPATEVPVGEACTRVFLGNLTYNIDEATLYQCIPGITSIEWITDRWTGDFYGTAFAEFATLEDATACVGMMGTPVGPKGFAKRPLKANFAPARGAPLGEYAQPENDSWW